MQPAEERRKEDRPPSNQEHQERRKSVKCACGKWQCGRPGHQSPGSRWTCFLHPQYGFGTSDAYLPGDKNYGADLQIPKHHTDGTVACGTNHRTPEQQQVWEEERTKWRTAQAKMPDLAAVMTELDRHDSLMDGHDMFKFVVDNPELATICLTHLYNVICGIEVGKRAMAAIPVRNVKM